MCMKTSVVYRLNPLGVSTFLWKKSHDHSVAACRFRNRSQTGSTRSGAGSIPCSFKIERTVVLETDMIPSLRSSPRMREYPHPGDFDISRTSLRISAFVRGLPARFFGFLFFGARSHFWNVLNCTMEMRCRSSFPTALPNRINLRLSFGVRETRLGSFDLRIWFSMVSYWIWAMSWS